MNQRAELNHEVRRDQPRPVAGVWACDNCGRRIQVVMESTVPKKQAFVCVCGAEMRPGDEHVAVGEDNATVANELSAVDKVGPDESGRR
jgi:hypothetical protein